MKAGMVLGAILIAAFCAACAVRSSNREVATDTTRTIDRVLAEHTHEWMKLPGVTGTGETLDNGKPAVTIFVDTLTDTLKQRLPSTVDGYPIVIKEIGKVQAR